MYRAAGLWIAVSLGLTGWIYLQGDTSPRELPIVFACAIALGGATYVGGRCQAARRQARSVATVWVVADDGGRLVVERSGQPRSVRRLRDGAVVADAAAAPVPRDSSHDIDFQTGTVLFGDVARLWFTGEKRRTLHGLQPQPATPLEFIRGQLVTTQSLLKEPPSPLPILILHSVAVDDDEAERLSLVSLDGTARWELGFETMTIGRARKLHVTGDHLVFELGARSSEYALDGRTIRRRGKEKQEIVVLALGTGAVTWRELV